MFDLTSWEEYLNKKLLLMWGCNSFLPNINNTPGPKVQRVPSLHVDHHEKNPSLGGRELVLRGSEHVFTASGMALDAQQL